MAIGMMRPSSVKRWALAATVCMLAACGSDALPAGSTPTPAPPSFMGAEVTPASPAPPLAMDNYTGTPINITQYRGKAVLVTFVYTHCTSECPIIMSNLGTADRELGADASHVQIIAVTSDPVRDTPAAVSTYLQAHGLTGRVLYLLGTQAQDSIAWTDWQIQVAPDATIPTQIDHNAEVFGVSASGMLTTVYAANFKPSDIVHDVKILQNE